MTRMIDELLGARDAWGREARRVWTLAAASGIALDEEALILAGVRDLQKLRLQLDASSTRPRHPARARSATPPARAPSAAASGAPRTRHGHAVRPPATAVAVRCHDTTVSGPAPRHDTAVSGIALVAHGLARAARAIAWVVVTTNRHTSPPPHGADHR